MKRTDHLDVYVMDVLTFGATSSPCSAQFVKNSNALEFADEFPDAANAIIKSHYVDDYFDSVNSVEEAVQRAKEVAYIHAKGGFKIRNWVSNSEEVLRNLDEQSVMNEVRLIQDKIADTERVLGITWNPREDAFSFSTNHRQDLEKFLIGTERPTKRIILSCVMGFFDSQGMFSHFTIHGKLIVQDLWRLGCDWDEAVDDETWATWKRWTKLLPEVESVRIPRAYFGSLRSDEIESLELHVFTDASEHAYGAVAYFRAMAKGSFKCALVMARAKVSPLKRQSIPRLELLAAVLGARLLRTVESGHSLPIHRRFLWTDSQTVLSWIRSDQHKYKQFVAFRIGEIHELTNLAEWRWIPSKQNIADVLTKWGQGPPLDADGPWFAGPQFLYEDEDCWPTQKLPSINIGEEMRAHLLFHNVTMPTDLVIHVHSMSRWTRIIRVTAYTLRFIENCRRKQKGDPIWTTKATENQATMLSAKWQSNCCPLQQEEFLKAETVLWKQAQYACYPDEVCTLRKNQTKNPDLTSSRIGKSSALYKLTPVMDDSGVIRVGGRLEKAAYLPFDTKYPIVLPKDDVITARLVQHYHERFGHANRETVFNEIRQRFYIPKLRSVILKVMKNCVWCRVYRCSPRTPKEAPLPVPRVTACLRPFSSVGVDYLGPIDVTVGRRKEKRYVALFTCLAMRAVHVEVVHSLTAHSCLMAIRRFCCRRGVPEEFVSDNATNFKSASKELARSINEDCADHVTSSRTKWTFIPPGTPHMGGAWERMVRSVKEALKVFDDGRKLTDEVLSTTLAEAEDMINSRPLTYVPQESAEIEAVSPNHFLRGTVRAEDMNVDGVIDFAAALRDVYKRSQYLADLMWTRWSKEYLPTINHRTKWFEDRDMIHVGDLVFVVDGRVRKSWTRGIVEEVYPGSDGRIRQVCVRTSGGRYKRATANLAVLEIRDGKSGTAGGAAPELRPGECDGTTGNPRTDSPLA